jgi:hypothetical protein
MINKIMPLLLCAFAEKKQLFCDSKQRAVPAPLTLADAELNTSEPLQMC